MRESAIVNPKITPFLWFDDNALEAARFYTSIFKNSSIEGESEIETDGGDVTSVTFWLDGQKFIALNGGPMFTFTPAISFFVRCETQAEIDDFLEKLSAGGGQQQCGWIRDAFGVSWQIVPAVLGELLEGDDGEKASRVMAALRTMQKLDIAGLQQAARAESPAAR